MLRSTPPFFITNRLVTRINAAQPFMLIVVHIGRIKRENFLSHLTRFSTQSIVTGKVAALLFVKRAVRIAGIIFLKCLNGLIPRQRRKIERTIKNWIRFPLRTTAV